MNNFDIWFNARWGFESAGITIHPTITGSSRFPVRYCGTDYEGLESFILLDMKDTVSEIPYRDYKIFLRRLEQDTVQADRVTILLENGRGIKYISGNGAVGEYGFVDDIGEVKDVIGYVYDMGGYMSLKTKDGELVSLADSPLGINGID